MDTVLEIVFIIFFGGWALLSLGVVSDVVKPFAWDFFRFAPRWNLFSAGEESGQAALVIYLVDKQADGLEIGRTMLTSGQREWRPWFPCWSVSLLPLVFLRRLAKSTLKGPEPARLSRNGNYQRLLYFAREKVADERAVSRQIVIFAERCNRQPELLFASPDEPL